MPLSLQLCSCRSDKASTFMGFDLLGSDLRNNIHHKKDIDYPTAILEIMLSIRGRVPLLWTSLWKMNNGCYANHRLAPSLTLAPEK